MSTTCMSTSGDLWVGFDVDDVLFELRHIMAEGMSRRLGRRFDVREWTDYNFFEGHMPKHEFMKMIIDDQMLEQCGPERGAVEALKQLEAEGLKIALITARGFHPFAQAVTDEAFRRHDMPFHHLHVVEHGKGKKEPALEIPNLIAYVDDHGAHLDSIADAFLDEGRDIHLSLLTRPWNATYDRHHRIESISQYVDVVMQRVMLHRAGENPVSINRPKC